MEDVVHGATAGSSGQIVVAGAGYAGLHVALLLAAKLKGDRETELVLVDRHDQARRPAVMAATASASGNVNAVGPFRPRRPGPRPVRGPRGAVPRDRGAVRGLRKTGTANSARP
jgi:glycine/D-amino acid oxidase-like deaminating enzyme